VIKHRRNEKLVDLVGMDLAVEKLLTPCPHDRGVEIDMIVLKCRKCKHLSVIFDHVFDDKRLPDIPLM